MKVECPHCEKPLEVEQYRPLYRYGALALVAALFIAMIVGWVSYGSASSVISDPYSERFVGLEKKYNASQLKVTEQKQIIDGLNKQLAGYDTSLDNSLKQQQVIRDSVLKDRLAMQKSITDANNKASNAENRYFTMKAQWEGALKVLEDVTKERDQREADYLKLWKMYKDIGGK